MKTETAAFTKKIQLDHNTGSHLVIKETKRRWKFLISLIIGIIVFIVIALFLPRFLHPRNLKNILVQSSTLGLMAIGMTLVYIIGGMDLSIPSVMAMSENSWSPGIKEWRRSDNQYSDNPARRQPDRYDQRFLGIQTQDDTFCCDFGNDAGDVRCFNMDYEFG